MSNYSEKLRRERREALAQRALPAEAFNEYGEVFAVTKTEAGASFPAAAYAYVPDASMPSTWKLRLWATPDGGPDAHIVGAAIAALGPGGFRGNKVQIPAADLPAVKAKVAAAWKKANPDKKPSEMPSFSLFEEVVTACGDMMDHGSDEPIDGDDDFLEALLHHHDEILDLIDSYEPTTNDVKSFADDTDTAVRESSAKIYNLLGKLVVNPPEETTQAPDSPDSLMAQGPVGYNTQYAGMPPAFKAAILKNLQKKLAAENDPDKKAKIQAQIDKFSK